MTEQMTSWRRETFCRHRKAEESRRNNVSRMVERKTQTRIHDDEQKGRHRHGVIKSPQNTRPAMVERCTESAQIKMGRSTSKKILMRDAKITEFTEYKGRESSHTKDNTGCLDLAQDRVTCMERRRIRVHKSGGSGIKAIRRK